MNKVILIAALGVLIAGCTQLDTKTNKKSKGSTLTFENISVDYPNTMKDTSVTDDYHGRLVTDHYRWLEDDNSAETKSWVGEQNKATFGYLDQIPYRDAIEGRLEKLWNFERFSTPFKKGGKYYYFKNDGLQNQAVMYRQETLEGPATEVLDPNQFSEDGTASLGGYAFSKSGRYLAYQVSEGGSDWQTAYVMDMESGKQLEDKVEWIKFSSLSWSKDGFFYSRYPEPSGDSKLSGRNEFHQVYYHRVGDSQDKDELVFADRAHPQRGFTASTSQDERYLALGIWESTSGNALYFKDLSNANNDFVPIMESFDSDFIFIDNIDDNLLVLTNYKAPNWRLVSINTQHFEEKFWEDLIPESTDVLRNVDLLGGHLVATYINNASSLITLYDLKGQPSQKAFRLPSIGTVGGFSGDKNDNEAFFSFSSYTRPTTIYAFDVKANTSKVFKAPSIDFDADKYVTEQVWYESYDGTRVPMFVTHKKGLVMDGKRPTLLYGYGGFDIPILPGFNTTRLNMAPIILENDGVFAVANIRGGGEFGKAWHQAGTKERKQNVFNDFQAAAEYLIAQKYTSSDKLAIYGRSNGGLLIGACMTQRPDLYKVALPAVGVLDMLRYQDFTIGRAWSSDYGLSENPKDFDYLYQYSPLHNAVPAKYPATMITTADHDDRVVPAHSFKFAAALQDNQKGDSPVLIRVETSAGHGAGKPTSKKIEEAADILSFTFYNFKENIEYENKVLQ